MKPFRSTIALALLAATATFSSLAQAQEFKLGFVNTERIFREAATAWAAAVA